MVEDKANKVVNEQVSRIVREILNEIKYNPQWKPPEYMVMSPNTPLETVAFGLAMVRVVHSAHLN